MKTITSLLFILLLTNTFYLSAQSKTYLGIEFGPKFETYYHADNGTALYSPYFFYWPYYGFTLGQEFNPRLYLESGFYFNDYGESYMIEGRRSRSSSNANFMYQIPLRLKNRIFLYKDNISITPSLGYLLSINTDAGGSSGGGHKFEAPVDGIHNDSTRSEHLVWYSEKQFLHMMEAGISLDMSFDFGLIFYLSTSYIIGFEPMVKMDVKYWINDQPEQSGIVFSEGGQLNIMLGMKYAISNLWRKKTKSKSTQ